MDLNYGPRHLAFRDDLRAFLKEHEDRAPRGEVVIGRPSPEDLAWRELLIERGYLGRGVPKEYGGAGADADILETFIIDDEFTLAGIRGPYSVHTTIPGTITCCAAVLAHGTEEQKKRYIGPGLAGTEIWCQGFSEPSSGSDLASLRTTAVPDGDDFVINGQKIWTSNAHVADMMFALVRTETDVPKHQGLSFILIPMNTPGVEVRPLQTMTGNSEFCEVFFTDARVPQKNLVGPRGAGWKVANTALETERILIAGNVGWTEGLLKDLERLMLVADQSGARAMDNPIYRERFMKLSGSVQAVRCNSMRMKTRAAKKSGPGMPELIAKLQTTRLNHEICGLAIDCMGQRGTLFHGSRHEPEEGKWQIGYMYWLGVMIGGGTEQIQKNIISERGLGMPREPKLSGVGKQ